MIQKGIPHPVVPFSGVLVVRCTQCVRCSSIESRFGLFCDHELYFKELSYGENVNVVIIIFIVIIVLIFIMVTIVVIIFI